MKLRFVTSWISLIAFVALGCGGPLKTYPGPKRSPDQVAILEADGRTRILGVDGRKYFHRELEVLPGEHAIVFKFTIDHAEIYPDVMLKKHTDRATFVCELKFVFEAGHTYRIERDKIDIMGKKVDGSDLVTFFDAVFARVLDLNTGHEVAALNASTRPGPGVCPLGES